jgi:hypothetical protein
MSKGKKSPAIDKIDAAKVESVSQVDIKDIPEGADVKEGVELTGDEAEIQRVIREAEAAGCEVEAEKAEDPNSYESILARIKAAVK